MQPNSEVIDHLVRSIVEVMHPHHKKGQPMKTYIRLLLFLIVLGLLGSCVRTQAEEPSRPDDVVVLAQKLVDFLVMEDFAGAVENFDDTMKKALPLDKLQETWKALIGQVGPFQRQVSTRTEKQQGYDVVSVTCKFEQTALDVKVVFNEALQIAGLFFVPVQSPAESQEYAPPTYVKSDVFQEKAVLVGTGEWPLSGTLSLPEGDGPFPAVVLVHGSGPQDRDETIGPNKPFRDLALGLASRGIAVLRYEKRTKEHATKCAAMQGNVTVYEETIEDVLAAVSLLRETEGIDAERIFVLGHSLGGMLVPRIGILDPDMAGFIIMAGTSRSLEEVILEQYLYIFALDGALSDGEKKQLEEIEQQIARVKDPELSIATPASDLPLGLPAKYWLDLRGYSPPEVAKDLQQPMLILQGERDYQVTTEDFEGWKIALSSRENVKFKLYPTLNHLFIEGEGPSTPAEYEIAGHVAERVIDDMANWIEQH